MSVPTLKLVVLALLLIVGATAVIAGSNAVPPQPAEKLQAPVEVTDIEGIWENEAQQAYTIRHPKDDVYVVQATNGDVGIATYTGKTFIVAYNNPKIRAGLAIYRLEVEGKEVRLVGKWATLPGDGNWGEETLIKIKGFAKQ